MSLINCCELHKIKAAASEFLSASGLSFDFNDNIVFLPAFCDVHVHFREPGFSYKETFATGSAAAAHGGYTAVCTMPNLKPVPDSVEAITLQKSMAEENSLVRVFPYGSITKGQTGEELADLDGTAKYAIAFSDDGRGVQSDEMMQRAMLTAKKLGKMIVAHCEDNSLLRGGYIHDGKYAKEHGHAGICSESEYGQIERDLKLVEKTGCAYHVCHISAKESVELIRKAKAKGLDVSCETAPHYLILCDEDLKESGNFKMNPPIRSSEDRDALIEGIIDGTIDMIATDHAPHSAEEKSKGLKDSLMGVVGIETAFPLLYTGLVKKGIISLEKLIDLISTNPKKRFGIETYDDFTIFDLSQKYVIDENFMLSKGKSTPFLGTEVYGKCLLTVCDNNIVYK